LVLKTKKIQMYFAECPGVALGKAVEINLCREPLGGTRQRRRLCRVPPIWHSANHILKIKKSLPSAASRALGKEHQLSQTDGFSFFSLSLTLTPPLPALAADPAPAPALAAGHAPPPALRTLARACRAPVLTACLLRRRRPLTTSTPSTTHDLHAVTPVRRRAPSTSSK
jgi:hypothetical protein